MGTYIDYNDLYIAESLMGKYIGYKELYIVDSIFGSLMEKGCFPNVVVYDTLLHIISLILMNTQYVDEICLHTSLNIRNKTSKYSIKLNS